MATIEVFKNKHEDNENLQQGKQERLLPSFESVEAARKRWNCEIEEKR